MRIVSNLYHSPAWSKMVNILISKQDTKLIPMALCSPIIKKTFTLYPPHLKPKQTHLLYAIICGCGGKNPCPYDNKSRPQIALYVFSFDQIPYYEAINIWYKAYNTPWYVRD